MKKIAIKHPIDRGVPIPVSQALPLGSMEVGDSIEFPVADRPKVAVRASILKRQGMTFTIRKTSEGKCRIWRTQ